MKRKKLKTDKLRSIGKQSGVESVESVLKRNVPKCRFVTRFITVYCFYDVIIESH